jgi:hypothetical protein
VHTWSELWSALTEPSAAAAVYLVALQLRLSSARNVEENVLGILIEAGLSSQELAKAQRALEVFLDLIQRERNLWEVIEALESDNYETFKRALYSFLRRDAKPEDVRRAVRALVELRKSSSLKTKRGSYKVMLHLKVTGDRVEDFYIGEGVSFKYLRNLGLLVMAFPSGCYPGYCFLDVIVPAPYVDMDILRLFPEVPEGARAEAPPAESAKATVPPGFTGVKPSREVLEGIVAEALRGLGFATQTNVRLPAKGGDIEVDVWGVKSVGNAQFRVYVSCKNWDRDVDRTVVDHEFGRVLQLYQLPHLRILVVRSLTEPARKAAFDDGFFVIELGDKATTENAQEIYNVVYDKLKEIFIGIAPERIMKAIERLRDVLRELEELV